MAKFIDLDGLAYTYGKIKALISSSVAGKAEKTHTHAAGDITSGTMPVTRGGTGHDSVDTTPTSGSTKMVTSGGIFAALANKAATDLSNVEASAFQEKAAAAGISGGTPTVAAASSDGVAYTAAVTGVTALSAGLEIQIIPDRVSASTTPTLNVNNLGAKGIRLLTGSNTSATATGAMAAWLSAGKPVTVKYNGTYWIVMDMQRTSAASISGDIIGIQTKTIGTTWTENEDTGVKSQTVTISGMTADDTANVDVYYNGDGSADSYATFVEQQNQFLEFVTNGYAETVEGGITFYIFGDAPTVSIPIVVEVI